MPVGKRHPAPLSSTGGLDVVKVVVGPKRDEFLISRRLLISCEYFRARLGFARAQSFLVIRLEGQCPDMFRLFEYWLTERKGLSKFVDNAEFDDSCEELHWDLVNLQLFAANIGEAALQDVAMDALQDLYLRCNWEIDPDLVKYVYTECDPEASYCLRSLRRWIVAMIAWGMGDTEAGGALETVFGECVGLREEYDSHLHKVAESKLDVDYKNPQLRLPSNYLRNGERQFGYRQCSFHTHRSAVGQGRCPHAHSLSPFIYSPLTDGYVESDSDRSDSQAGSRMTSPFRKGAI
ncbi:hypothetical protein SAMD00023353_4600480 [Rosellinia necatrix]|uniref:Uncharacterized protein n=1 Tax=Rosellinia necatrix TaxID=77044 RepID=A0A1W2TPH7_ROSNE|nr:hypothetical protein SAMD00023353_4600480 [Rosellinia necatrix]